MTNQGPPTPPPPPNMPPPPSGGKPPPAMKAPPQVKKIAEVPQNEKLAWLTDPTGLNLNALKVAYYPPEELLSQLNISPERQKQLLPESDDVTKENVTRVLLKATEALFKEMLEMAANNPELTQKLMIEIDKKVRNWKNGASGLNDCYIFMQKEVSGLRSSYQQSLAAKSLGNDEEYKKLVQIRDNLLQKYNTLLEQYKNATSDKQVEIYKELQQIIKELDTQRDKVQNYKSSLEMNKEAVKKFQTQLDAPQKAREEEIAKKGIQIQELSNLEGHTDPETQAENKIIIARLKQEIQDERSKPLMDPQKEQELRSNLENARSKLQQTEQKVARAKILQALFNPPESWKEVQNLERKKEQTGPKRGKGVFDTKGMYLGEDGTEPPNKRQFDLRFLDGDQLSRLARFFSERPSEYKVVDHDSLLELTKRINGVIQLNELFNFDVLMDIAEGRIRRKAGEYAPSSPIKMLDNIQPDSSKVVNYEKLLEKQKSYNDIAANAQRGITITKGAPISRKRSIDLDYLTDNQMTRLQSFFAKSATDLKGPEGALDREAIKTRVNHLMNQINLTFEDIIDVAEGHLVRKGNHFAPENRFGIMLSSNLERKGNAPDYKAAVQQRTQYIQDQERKKKEAAENEKLQRAQEIEQLKSTAQELLNQYQRDFAQTIGQNPENYIIDSNNLKLFQLYGNFVQSEMNLANIDPNIQEAVKLLLQEKNPNVQLGATATVGMQPQTPTPITPTVEVQSTGSMLPTQTDTARPKSLINQKPTTSTDKHTGPVNDSAIKILKDLLGGIVLKQRYQEATKHKSFISKFKPQHHSRPKQLAKLDSAIQDAIKNINQILQEHKKTPMSQQELDSKMNEVIKGVQKNIHDIKVDMHQSGHKFKGTSRMENVLNDLNQELSAVKLIPEELKAPRTRNK